MSAPSSLAYMVIEATDLAPWHEIASDVLGMAAIEQGDGLHLRMDSRPWRIAVDLGSADRVVAAGWVYADEAALHDVARRLAGAGVAISPGSAAACAERGVTAMYCLFDPVGNGVELCHGEKSATELPRFARPIGGFVTGGVGLGHIVYAAPDIAPLAAFYEDLLGFRLSDYAAAPFPARFLHVNGRHHSLAFVQTERTGVHHLMIEYADFDDVGQALDRAEDRVAVTLGRHSNDWMTSFYMTTPAGMMIEAGWGGREIDPAAWTPEALTDGPSLWGHERSWLTPEVRAQARAMRLAAAESGLKAPLPHES